MTDTTHLRDLLSLAERAGNPRMDALVAKVRADIAAAFSGRRYRARAFLNQENKS